MIKKIPVDQLSIGMYVCGNDRKWLETPFFRTKFLLKTEQQLADLREYCTVVFIDTGKGADVSRPVEPAAANEGQMSGEEINPVVYTEGSIVELNNGQLALVLQFNPMAALNTKILLLTDVHKNMLFEAKPMNMVDIKSQLTIVNKLDADDPLVEFIQLFSIPFQNKDV